MISSKKTSKSSFLTQLISSITAKNILILCLAASSSIVITACSESQQDQAVESLGLDEKDVFSLKVGSCFNEPKNPEVDEEQNDLISDVPMRECNKPHDNEVFHVINLPDGPTVPSADTLDEAVYAECDKAYKTFVGIPYDDSTYNMTYLSPSNETWTQKNDREVVCYAYNEDGKQLTASIKGTRA